MAAAVGGVEGRGRGALDREVRREEVRLEVAVVDRRVGAQRVVADPEVRVASLCREMERRQDEVWGEHLGEAVHQAGHEEDCGAEERHTWRGQFWSGGVRTSERVRCCGSHRQ